MDRSELLVALVNKFPDLDPQWDQAARSAWFDVFGRLLSLVENGGGNHRGTPAPATPGRKRRLADTPA